MMRFVNDSGKGNSQDCHAVQSGNLGYLGYLAVASNARGVPQRVFALAEPSKNK